MDFSFKVGIDMVIIFLANGLTNEVRDFGFLGIEVIDLRGMRGEEDLSGDEESSIVFIGIGSEAEGLEVFVPGEGVFIGLVEIIINEDIDEDEEE